MPLSHWIDLRDIEKYEGIVSEVAPEPTSMTLELHPLDHLYTIDTVAKEDIQHHPESGNLEGQFNKRNHRFPLLTRETCNMYRNFVRKFFNRSICRERYITGRTWNNTR